MRLKEPPSFPSGLYERYVRAIGSERLPLAMVDLDAIDRNVETLLGPIRARKKTLRIASKSIRSTELLRYVARAGGDSIRGIMCFSPREARFLVEQGFDDLLIAYPTAQAADAIDVAECNARGAVVSMAADDPAHLDVAEEAARNAGTTIPIVVDIDVSFRPLGDRLPIGVLRSPLHEPTRIVDFVEAVGRRPHLRFAGLLAYEAHIAGVSDHSRGAVARSAAMRAMKKLARREVVRRREAICDALGRRGIAIPLFNGGGSGSVEASSADGSLTEVAAGSGFLDSHLFDGYDGLELVPAAFFVLQVTRIPRPGIVTCQSGGFIASGATSPDRAPRVALPEGLALTELEGAGEVQTPLVIPPDRRLPIGAPVFFRHAKAGELAEHFREYQLVRGHHIEGRALTYRGAGHCFG